MHCEMLTLGSTGPLISLAARDCWVTSALRRPVTFTLVHTATIVQ